MYRVTRKNTTFDIYESEIVSQNFWRNRFETWEDDTFDFMFKYLDKNKTFIDIGAWIGPLSLVASFHSKKCICYEPDIVAYNEFVESIKLSGIENIVLENKSISIHDEITLGSGSLGQSVTRETDHRNSFVSKCVKIREILETYGLNEDNISLIKIDIEGHESELLKDETLINLNIPMHVSFHPGWSLDRENFYQNIKTFLINTVVLVLVN